MRISMNKTRLSLILIMVLTMMVVPTKALAESTDKSFQDELEVELQQAKQELIDKEEWKRVIQRKYTRTEYEDLKKELEESDYEDKELQLQALDEIIESDKFGKVLMYTSVFMALIVVGVIYFSKT